MDPLLDVLAELGTRLDGKSIAWALVGGLAVGVRAEPRFTRDVDLAVRVSGDADSEALVVGLRSHGYRVLAVLEHQTTGRLATVRLSSPGDFGVVADLLFASSGLEPEIVAQAEPLEIRPGLFIPVATRAHLIATKILARNDATRPKDLQDLQALKANCSPADLLSIQNSLNLIEERGFHRGKDLNEEFSRFLLL